MSKHFPFNISQQELCFFSFLIYDGDDGAVVLYAGRFVRIPLQSI